MKYQINNDNLPKLIYQLEAGNDIMTQSGKMSWHTGGISTKRENSMGLKKMLNKTIIDENISLIIYESHFDGQEIVFSPNFPGEILKFDLSEKKEGIVIQKQNLLASEINNNTSLVFKKKMGIGLFGGDDFIILRLLGDGLAFLEVNGSLQEYTLESGKKIVVETGHLVAMDYTCRISVAKPNGIKNRIFGGEPLMHTVIHGPGKVYLQSISTSKLKNLFNINIQEQK